MSRSRYRLTPIGWIEAALFIGAPLLSAWELTTAAKPSAVFLAVLGAASLVGVVMLLIGREIVTTTG
jgi:hypothetical protein